MENYSYANIFPANFRNILKSEQWKQNICHDEVIGFIYKEKCTIVFKRRDDYKSLFVGADQHDEYCMENGIKVEGKIAVILESPHVNEFFNEPLDIYKMNQKTYGRPANADTGQYIDKYLMEIFYEKLINANDGVYSVTLVNSIQQQCSLRDNTLYYRDRVWVYCWFGKINNFVDRLKKLDPEFILNCTTIGKHYRMNDNCTGYIIDEKKTLSFTKKFINDEFEELGLKIKEKATIRSLIADKIEKNFSEVKTFHSTHPSSWRYPNNRKIVNVS